MEKRTVIFLVATVLIWIIWYQFSPVSKQLNQQKAKKTEQADKVDKTQNSDNAGSEKKATETTGSDDIVVVKKKKGNKIEEKEYQVETEKYRFTFTNRGAAIKKAVYKEHNVELTVSQNFYKAKSNFDFAVHFNTDEFLNGSAAENTLWNIVKETGSEIVYSLWVEKNGVPLQIIKSYKLDPKKYKFNVSYTFINDGDKAIIFDDKSLIFSSSELIGPSLDFSNNYNKIAGSVYSKDGDFEKLTKGGGGILSSCSSGVVAGDIKKDSGNISWAGIMGRYFLIIMIPEGFSGDEIITNNKAKAGFRAGLKTRMDTLEAKQKITKEFTVYLGEKDKDKLKSVAEKIKPAADYSTLIEPIRNLVIWVLTGINKVIGNLGWALVIFSILTKLIFMPLTKKSTESMKKMQKLTPKMNEVKAKYKSDPKVMQQKMMELYKEHGVNPMGGCFPLLLQMPFFFALYSALINSIDLWNAPFILWIKDLSMPDTVHPFFGLGLNILPLIMVVTTFLQQKLTTVDTTGQQKTMMMIMPLIMLFIFWTMPSGLVLYWTLQNVFQIAHHIIVSKYGKNKTAEAS